MALTTKQSKDISPMTVKAHHREIERKWLMDSSILRFPEYNKPNVTIRQAYFSNECRVRVDSFFDGSRDNNLIKQVASMTVKISESELTRTEYNYEIPIDDAEVFLKRLRVIKKQRFDLGDGFTLDIFAKTLNGLLIVEKEYASEADAQQDLFPDDWDGVEVTGLEPFYNSNLAGKTWDENEGLIQTIPKNIADDMNIHDFDLLTGDADEMVLSPFIVP